MDTTKRVALEIGNTEIHYFTSQIIGKGTSSVVYQGFYGDPAIQAAIKEINKKDYDVYDREKAFFLNFKADPTTPCINVVLLHAWFEDEHNYYLAMEKADYNLGDYLVKYQNLERTFKIKIIEDVANGIDFLHEKNYLHRDIKPENVLIFGDGSKVLAKLGDFGVSRKMSNALATNSKGRGTENWMSPEAITAMHNDELLETTKYIDIFSFGMTAYFTLSNRQHPFHSSREHGFDEISNIKDKNVPPMELVEASKCYSTIHLLGWMMQKEPVCRPTIKKVKSHPMFWKPNKCLDFVSQIARTLNKKNDTECKEIRDDIDTAYKKIYRKLYNKSFDWMSHVDSRLFQQDAGATKKSRKTKTAGNKNSYCSDSIMSLVTLIRDKNEHFRERDEDLRRDFFEDDNGGYSEEKYIQYYLDIFPDAVIFLFCTFVDQTATYFADVRRKFYAVYDASFEMIFLRNLITK